MNKIIITILLLVNIGILKAQYTAIPDLYFEQELINQGIDSEGTLDGQVLTSDINTLTELTIFNTNASNLIGIEYFTALEEINIIGNENLFSLDLSNNVQLSIIQCTGNVYMNSFIVENLLLLESLQCFDNNITELNINDNIALKHLECTLNPLSSLDVSNSFNLEKLWCNTNNLSTLDISNNPNLIELSCAMNNLTSIDASSNPNLYYFVCSYNQLIFLDIRNGNNQSITTFGSINNPDLTCIYVDNAEYSTENWSSGIDETSTFVETQEECDALGIEHDSINNSLNIYPNPVNDILFIEYSDDNFKSIKLFNVYGSKVLNTKYTNFLNLEKLTNGVYFLKIITENDKEFIKKIIKN